MTCQSVGTKDDPKNLISIRNTSLLSSFLFVFILTRLPEGKSARACGDEIN